MAYLYEPGPVQSALSGAQPYIATSSGVYFIVPVMSFSILVGLALDYDIFLMSRVVEFRRLGWCAARPQRALVAVLGTGRTEHRPGH